MPIDHAARDAVRQNHSRASSVARSSELGVDLGRRDRRVTSRDVIERDRTWHTQTSRSHHAASPTRANSHHM
jgi:hypothetical protein